ncbi:hypothetical protein [Flavobacterium subsaxonicum]|nr:hypothetical protein [Flavobacterium subsaxonicum]
MVVLLIILTAKIDDYNLLAQVETTYYIQTGNITQSLKNGIDN